MYKHLSIKSYKHSRRGQGLSLPLVNQEPAIIEGIVNTHWPTTVFEHMVKILNSLYRKTLQRITQVFCSTLVYATNGAPPECQQLWSEYGGRDLQSYTV